MPRSKTYIVEDSSVIRVNLTATLEELVPVQVVRVAENDLAAAQGLTEPSSQFELEIFDGSRESGAIQ